MNSRVWAVLALLWTAPACAQGHAEVIETGTARIEVLGGALAQGDVAVAQRQSRLVVYRLDDVALPGATSVFVDGTYHASLIPGAHTELCYRKGPVELGARQMEVAQRAKDLPDTITALQLPAGRTQYLRVTEQGGRPVLRPVPAAQALQELGGTRQQKHTISRVAQPCEAVVQAAQLPPTPQLSEHTLSADSLFAFARSDRQGMTGQGMRALEQFAATLRRDYARIDRLHVVGHADPLGEQALNERLAIERANTVRVYLEDVGQLRVPISAEGRGAREPVYTGCPRSDSAQARACHLPNRRVAVEVTGIRR